jgi:hypothetical protein
MTVAILSCELALCGALVGWRVGLPATSGAVCDHGRRRFSVVGQLTIANWASLSYPRKIEFGKMQGQRNSGMSV